MIDALISSKTRIKLLLKFFLNSSLTAHLRGLENEFGESSNGIRVELNRLEDAGMLVSEMNGNKKLFRANTTHPLFSEIQSIVRKHIGLDRVVEQVVERLGEVEKVFLVGDFARGLDSPVIDLLLIGHIDRAYLVELIGKVEDLINRKVRYLVYTPEEADAVDWRSSQPPPLLLWSR